MPLFIMKNVERLYKKSSADVKRYFDKSTFLIFAMLIKDYKNVDIDEKTLVDAMNMEDALTALEKATVEVRDKTYIPFLQDFLSKLTVVCFSASGWDNQLMWSHYANQFIAPRSIPPIFLTKNHLPLPKGGYVADFWACYL